MGRTDGMIDEIYISMSSENGTTVGKESAAVVSAAIISLGSNLS